jgi:hypothetical protein
MTKGMLRDTERGIPMRLVDRKVFGSETGPRFACRYSLNLGVNPKYRRINRPHKLECPF